MKRALLLLCAVVVTAAASCQTAPKAEQPRVIVLGIDGATWTMIEPMMEAGELPNLKKLYESGLHGILESRPPIVSPVVWTTIFTGFLHNKHGVKDWKTSQSTNRRVAAIWEILRDEGKKVDVFNVPGSWPPDPVPGVMMAGFPLSGATYSGNTGELVSRDTIDNGKMPPAFRDSVETIREAVKTLEPKKWTGWLPAKVSSRPTFRGAMRIYRMNEDFYYLTPVYRVDDGITVSEPKTLRAEIAQKIGEPYIPEGPGWSKWAEEYAPEVLYPHLEQVFQTQAKGALEYAASDSNLFIFIMTLVDRISHPYWAYSHADDFPDLSRDKAKKYNDAVANAYRRSDERIGDILAKAGGTPYVLVISDHGFQSSTDASKPIGTHNPDGIYLLAGPGITKKTGTPKFIEDVTPTLLYLMDLPVGQDMDGKVFTEVTEMVGRELKTRPTWEKGDRDATDEPVDSDTWESLRGLGYVDGAPPREDKGGKKSGEKADEKAAAPDDPGHGEEDHDAAKPAPAKPGPAKPGAGKPGQRAVDEQPRPRIVQPQGGPSKAEPNALDDWPEPPHGHVDE